MQTFLPYADFLESAQCLDKRRCWKQTVEAKQLITGIVTNAGWKHHPAQNMWTNNLSALVKYYNTFLKVSIEKWKIKTVKLKLEPEQMVNLEMPKWLGDERLHMSHRIALLTKNYDWYKQFNWLEKPDINYKYFWPTIENRS